MDERGRFLVHMVASHGHCELASEYRASAFCQNGISTASAKFFLLLHYEFCLLELNGQLLLGSHVNFFLVLACPQIAPYSNIQTYVPIS